MLSRRHFCCAGVLAGTAASFGTAFAADQCAATTQQRQAALSPDDALAVLKAGNERFLSRNMRNCDLLGQVRATAGGQFPFALVIGCIDSRVPPELVFDQRIGDIFSARIAGNVADADADVVGSAEFATRLARAKLIVVLGHSECGAVKGAIDGATLGKLTDLLNRIKPAVEANRNAPGSTRRRTRTSCSRWRQRMPGWRPKVFTGTAKFFGIWSPRKISGSSRRCTMSPAEASRSWSEDWRRIEGLVPALG